jgi:Fe-S-cluster-containing dehydrogenase component
MKNKNDEALKGLSRRDFVRMGASSALTLGLGLPVARAFASAAREMGYHIFTWTRPHYDKYYCMVLVQNVCIDCEKCMDACKKTWNIPDIPDYYRTRILERHLEQEGEKPLVEFIPVLCYHCDVPACVYACPTSASYKRKEDGIVLVDPRKCIGCKACMLACPYDARYFNEEIYAIDKCTYCQPILEKGGTPACVEACPTGTRVFGDLNDRRSKVYKLLHQIEKKVWVLKPEADTRPRGGYIKI